MLGLSGTPGYSIRRQPLASSPGAYQIKLEGGLRMWLLHVHAQSYSRVFEVLPEEVENAELMIEDVVSHGLLALFGEVRVDDVTVHFSAASHIGQRDCSIQIQAQCSHQSFALLACTKEQMELLVGKSLRSLLKELFGPVTMNSVIVEPSSVVDV
ncbi:MAG: hypothetical protein ACJ788_06640 [Ktedonobacteraceae bacterium]